MSARRIALIASRIAYMPESHARSILCSAIVIEGAMQPQDDAKQRS
jgi:hypothetical protein